VPSWLQATLAVGVFWLAVVLIGRLAGAIRLVYVSLATLVLLVVALILQAEGIRSAGIAAMGLVVSLVVMGYALGFTSAGDDGRERERDAAT
jgi:hypothetical protein